MAAGLAVARATVSHGRTQPWETVSVLVRNNVLRVTSRSGQSYVDDPTVSLVEHVDRRTWRVTTDAGVFTVVRQGGCGCGGGR